MLRLCLCLLPIAYCLVPAFSAPMHPSVLAEMRARGDTCAWVCPSGVGDVWARVSARASSPLAGEGRVGGAVFFAGANKTATPKDTVRIAAIPVQFQTDAVATTTGVGQFKADGNGDTTSVGDSIEIMLNRADTYYRAVSYGRLRLSWTVFDTYMPTLSGTLDAYGSDNSTNDQTLKKTLVREALGRTDTYINHGAYDVVVIFTAGMASQISSLSRDVGAQFFNDLTTFTDTQTNDTVTHAILMPAFGRERTTTETITMLGTFCHEFGHALGLPDLYSAGTNGTGYGGIGDWGIMGTGNYAGKPQGDSPAWMDAWSREYFGWADTKLLTSDSTGGSFTLTKAESDSRIYKIKLHNISNQPDTEYFLMEVREPNNSGLDSVPGVGMLIWHILNTQGNFSDNNVQNLSAHTYRRVDLEEADGSDLNSSATTFTGTAAHPWPGSGSKTAIGDNSTPSSRGYYDTVARFALKSIALGSSVTFAVDFTDVTVAVATGSVKYPSTCLIGHLLSPWPRALSAARTARDWMLDSARGRAAVRLTSADP